MNKIIHANARTYLDLLPDHSFDVIFLDPPYGVKATTDVKTIHRPEGGQYDGVTEDWDAEYISQKERSDFIAWYVAQAKRLCKKDGSVWIMGNHINIFTVGHMMLEQGYYILNDVIWVKSNPTPNFRGVRFTNSIEHLIWALPYGKRKHYFNYQAMKSYNHGKQMRADWNIPVCSGKERLKIMDANGELVKAHQTQKPLELLKRVILSSLKEEGSLLDFFAGTGTSGMAAALYNREFTMIDSNLDYCKLMHKRYSDAGIESQLIATIEYS